uniref:CUB domain-containing protein n=1 Tax=Timema cristinae TaxID=61476 RepID=A0A7R9DME4_TIMCR|nr:unnamed protein product [Timema cristinae]
MLVFDAKSPGNVCAFDFIDGLQQYTFKLFHKTDDITIREVKLLTYKTFQDKNPINKKNMILGIHTFDHFGLAALNQTDSTDVNAYYDEVCYSSQSGLVVGDYLYIPLAQINSTSTTATQFCGVTLNGYSATSRAPGPFYVYFHSEHYRHSLANVGFHASYSISTC